MRTVKAGSRASRLAVVQTEQVAEFIKANHPDMEVEILTMTTTGDRILHKTLDQVGGKGLFVKELDVALRSGQTDFSVHSLKDMPMETPEDLPVIAYSRREDPRDVLVLPKGAGELDVSKPVGCSSRRRILQMREIFPQARMKSIRGNVLTRLEKLDAGEYGALILAAAGLKRLGLEDRISRYFSENEMIPAAGQGILCVQGRAGEDYSWLADFDCRESRDCAAAERGFVAALNGGCSSPVAAYAEVSEGEISLRGLYVDEASGDMKTGCIRGPREDAAGLGRKLAAQLSGCRGKVWLVGAGPGDFGLMTLKGLAVLENAETVVYDRLVGAEVLSKIPAGARAIDAGKQADSHKMPQEDISRLLLREALAGRRVVRLKGGDPFLFGRGGEELELLEEHGVPFEVVPGVTSALSVPAYSGISVTHRDFASSVHIITGHRRQGKELDVNFKALAETGGTLVFLMSVGTLEEIAGGLMGAGMAADTPAAVLERGTTAGQRRIEAPLGEIAGRARESRAGTPAIFVVGDVCALAQRFSWFDKMPLFGEKILVTRPGDRSEGAARRLRELGAEVICVPAVRTVPVSDAESLRAIADAIEGLAGFDLLVFTSAYGVKRFFELLAESGTDIRCLFGKRLAAIGPATADALRERGIFPDLIPGTYDGESLGQAIVKLWGGEGHAGQAPAGAAAEVKRILIPRARNGSRALTEELAAAGDFLVTDLPIYDTETEMRGAGFLREEFSKGGITRVMFTSASTVRGFAEQMESGGAFDFSAVRAVCIGRQTEAAARALGMRTETAKEATAASMVELIVKTRRTPGQDLDGM